MAEATVLSKEVDSERSAGLVNEKLTRQAFDQLSGNLAGYPFVKVVIDLKQGDLHFLHNRRYRFHSDYIAEQLLGLSIEEVDREIDSFNKSVYQDPERRFILALLALHSVSVLDDRAERFFSLETVEIDTMGIDLIRKLYASVKQRVTLDYPIFFKPANLQQEAFVRQMNALELPRIYSHELFAKSSFIALNLGKTRGRIRAFRTEAEYREARTNLEWYDIIVMSRVPDDIPRIAGIINAEHTTPLSHTNVLASGWQVPNAIQLGILDRIDREGLNHQWVNYSVDSQDQEVQLSKVDGLLEMTERPAWSVQRIKLEEPETTHTPILELNRLRMSDRYRYGTKAANLGELSLVLEQGSDRMLGFYRVKRPPRLNLLPHLAAYLELPEDADAQIIAAKAASFLRTTIQIPRGIAIPFSIQQEFLESSPRIQQAIGKLKMALEVEARETDALCLNLQSMIRQARFPEGLRRMIDAQVANHLAGVSKFVVRSSSNAEDLENFSAAGIYESVNHVASAESIFQSIKEVWASLVSPRSVRLRHEVGISLDDCYMGVIVQEEVATQNGALAGGVMGGVMITANPMNRDSDFRSVYINASLKSVNHVVQGLETPCQFLFNSVEGGGRTLSLGSSREDLTQEQKGILQKLAFVGRLLQSHFSPDYTFQQSVDIEWVASAEGLFILQLRPYAK